MPKNPLTGRQGSRTIADHIIAFNKALRFPYPLPDGVRVMNPFLEPAAWAASSAFYKKYYDDHRPRRLILGINPGRFGAGLTGVPFTDPKRLRDACCIDYDGKQAHEPSSEFIYEMIKNYGGPEDFYREFYINSVCPLGFTAEGKNGGDVNLNYYDRAGLSATVRPFALGSIRKQLAFTGLADVCFCLGIGKNADYLHRLNKEYRLFGRIVPLEHPRYIMQYRAKAKSDYIRQYLEAFAEAAFISAADRKPKKHLSISAGKLTVPDDFDPPLPQESLAALTCSFAEKI